MLQAYKVPSAPSTWALDSGFYNGPVQHLDVSRLGFRKNSI